MADDWRLSETRDQTLLYVVLRAASELAPRSDIPDVAEPLLEPVVAKVADCIARLVSESRAGADYTHLLDDIAALFSEGAELPARLANSPAWKIEQVVAQWISTARVLAEWRRVIESAPKNTRKPQEPEPEPEKRGWAWWPGSGREAKPSPGGLRTDKEKAAHQAAQAAADSVAALGQVRSLLEFVNNYPYVPGICEEHAQVFFLLDSAAVPSPAVASCAPATSRDTCIRSLLEWCGDLSRLQSNIKLPEDYPKQFARAATALLGRECHPHPSPGKVPITYWRNGNGSRGRPTQGLLVKIHRVPLVEADEKTVVVSGWATTPSPEKCAGTLLESLGQEPAFPSLRQACQHAVAAWPESCRKSLADGLPRKAADWSEGLHHGITDTAALTLVRLATLFLSGQSRIKKIKSQHFRFVLLLDAGMDIVTTAVSQDSPLIEGRLIPYLHDSTSPELQRRDKVKIKHADWPDLNVGVLGPEVLGAPPGTLAAVEDLDWRLWFLDTVRRNSLVDEAFADLIARALKRARHDSWESVKRKWMVAPNATAALEVLHDHLYRARVGLAGSTSLGQLGHAGRSLCSDLARCERAVLVALKEADPSAYDRIYPPRLVDASYDIDRWMTDDVCSDPRGTGFRVQWAPSAEPFGVCLRERAIQDKSEKNQLIEITLSAGKTGEQDCRFLNAPFFIVCPARPAGTYVDPLHRFARRIWQDSRAAAGADIAAALGSLRTYYLSADGDSSFNSLVKAALQGDRCSIEWLNLLRNDERFGFECHPPIAGDHEHVTVTPASASAALSWQDDEFVPRGGDVEVSFSMAPDRARRVLSRGLPAADAPEGLAQSIEACLREAPDEFRRLGTRIMDSTDRWITFPSDTPHPLTEPSLASLLATLPAECWDGKCDLQANVFDTLRTWVASLGHRLRPCSWRPLDGSSAADSPPTDCVRFHPTVPAGNIVVERFGLDGEHASAWAGYQSAGAAPAGYAVLVEAAQALSEDSPLTKEVKTSLAELPRHYLAGKAPLVGPALFNAIWDLVLGAPAAVGDSGSILTGAVAELLKASCGMTLFEPTGLGEYPSAWVRAPDGKSPRGDWITRVVRPGVRTSKNTLVWPAVVETE